MEEDSPQLSGLPTSADRATRLGEVPHFTCKRDQKNKERLYGEIGNPTEAGLSPSRGPLPPCQQSLLK